MQNRHTRGFSILELLLVLAVIAVLIFRATQHTDFSSEREDEADGEKQTDKTNHSILSPNERNNGLQPASATTARTRSSFSGLRAGEATLLPATSSGVQGATVSRARIPRLGFKIS